MTNFLIATGEIKKLIAISNTGLTLEGLFPNINIVSKKLSGKLSS